MRSSGFINAFALSSLLVQVTLGHYSRGHGNYAHSHLHTQQARDSESSSFQLVPSQSFSSSSLPQSCQDALYDNLQCDSYVSTLGRPVWHGGLNDSVLTDAVCSTQCGQSLSSFHDNVVAQCGADATIAEGIPALSVIDSIWSGWNETCLKNDNGTYCNDVIDSWDSVSNLTDVPVADICDDCWIRKLELMQQSPYSAYSTPYETMLNYSISVCNLKGVETQPTPGGLEIPAANATCSTDNWYTVQTGDTCDSISIAHSISSSTLYQINPTLYNCSDPMVGLDLCLPLACEDIYEVVAGDNCSSIAVTAGISWMKLISYNGMVDSACSNVADTALLGGVRCVSPPGGTFNLTVSSNSSSASGVDGQGGSGSGYGTSFVALPSDVTLAEGTTTDCGDYYTVVSGDTCVSLLAEANTPFNLFMAANPSITSAAVCDDELTVGVTYCIHPMSGFNTTSVSGNLTVSTNGLCGNGTTCLGSSFGDCCSISGYCGSTSNYCTAGICDATHGLCVSGNPVSLDGLCASQSSTNATCAGSEFGFCCSVDGYCGSTSDYCGYKTCQSEFGSCDEAPSVSSDGLCGALSSVNATCAGSTFGDCCSIHGYCGSASDYCAYDSCQSAFGSCDAGSTISVDGLCGALSSSNATCAGSTFGDCCSIDGYCGSTSDYCAYDSCQSVFGTCDPGPTVSSDGLCGALSSTNATCAGSTFGSCCSVNGYCGSTDEYCGIGTCDSAFGNCDTVTVSPDGLCGSMSSVNASCAGSQFGDCCSMSGYCGSTDAYCGIGQCQSAFGSCDELPISSDGLCGFMTSNSATCLGSQFGDCCSVNGYCGGSDAYCAAANCLTDYGSCSP